MNQSTSDKKNFFSEWLEKLQQESWQLELLISGLALFGIWESQNVIREFEYYLQINSVSDIRFATNIFVKFLWAGWVIFLINLLIHIIIRGFWIGAIGLRYVSGDIDFDALKYSDKFINHYKKKIGSYDEYIEKLEKISSVLFSFTFLLFFMFLSLVIFNLFFALIISIVGKLIPDGSTVGPQIFGIIGIFYYGLGLLVLFDFISLGAFKKIKEPSVSTIYFWIYRFYSTISLSFLYRPLFLNFIDNTYTRRLFFLAIPYSVILISLNGIYFERYPLFPSSDNSSMWNSVPNTNIVNWNNYDDLREAHVQTYKKGDSHLIKKKINYCSLHQFEIDNNELKLFLEYRENDEKYLLNATNTDFTFFRKKGVRHSLFFKNNIPDEKLIDIERQEYEEYRLARKVVKNEELPDTVDQSLIIKYNGRTEEELESIRNEIKEIYDEKKNEYLSNQMSLIINGFKDLHKVTLDGQNVNDAMTCHFYEHPNMHEKGLLCYIRIDSLTNGTHLMMVNKRQHELGCNENCKTISRSIPFRKIE